LDVRYIYINFLEEEKEKRLEKGLMFSRKQYNNDHTWMITKTWHFSSRDVKALCNGSLPPYLYRTNEDKTQKRFIKDI